MMTAHEKQLQLIHKDFKNFLYITWKHLGLPDPTPVQYEIADYLQHGPKRRMTQAFRGVGKSWITSAFALWRLLKNPDEKILVVSASSSRANDFSMFTKRLISEMPILQHLYPKRDQRASNVAFDVGPAKAAHAPSVKSVGIFGQLTGSRASLIISDDVEVSQNSLTEDAREKLLKATAEFDALLVPDVGEIVVLGTPQSEESIYNKFSDKGYEIRVWTARYPKLSKVDTYLGRLAPSIFDKLTRDPSLEGTPVDTRFDDQDLSERELSYGKAGFALQFMLDTSLSDAERYPLKTSDLIVMNTNTDKAPVSISWGSGKDNQLKELPVIGFTGDRWHKPFYVDTNWIDYEGSVMAIDPSGRGKDETAYAVVKHLHGYLYVTAAGAVEGNGYDTSNMETLAKIARDHKVNYVLIEANFGDGMYNQLFKPVLARYHKCSLEEVKVSIQKERRIIDTLEPVLSRHKLVVDYQVVQEDLKEFKKENPKYSLFYQLTRITYDRGSLRHDDRLDALSLGVSYWTDSMARDEDLARDDWKSRELDEQLERFMNNQALPQMTSQMDNRWTSVGA